VGERRQRLALVCRAAPSPLRFCLLTGFYPEAALLIQIIHGLHPEGRHCCLIALSCAMVPTLCVDLSLCWYSVDIYASAQRFDFLDLGKNLSFPI
jgi:hypothetical protein